MYTNKRNKQSRLIHHEINDHSSPSLGKGDTTLDIDCACSGSAGLLQYLEEIVSHPIQSKGIISLII